MVGTSLKEPGCDHVWCGLKDSVKWYGPAIEGKVITAGHPMGEDLSNRPIKERWEDEKYEYDDEDGELISEEEDDDDYEEEYEEEYEGEYEEEYEEEL